VLDEKDMIEAETDLHEWPTDRVESDMESAIVLLSRALVTVFASYCLSRVVRNPLSSFHDHLRMLYEKSFMDEYSRQAMDIRDIDEETVN